MGHLSTIYWQQAGPELSMATEYAVNVHSYESDLCAGVVFAPVERRGQAVRVRLGLGQVGVCTVIWYE